MQDPNDLQQQILQQAQLKDSQQAQYDALQQAKLEALQQVLGNRGDYTYLDLNDLIDPDNKNWADYTYWLGSHNNRIKRQRHIDAGSPVGIFIQKIRDAETIGDVYKQSELWNSYDPLSSRDSARKYFRYIFGGKEPDPVQATAGDAQGAQGVVTVGGTGTQGAQGAQAGVQAGNNSGATQGVQAGAQAGAGVVKGGTQGTQTGGTGSAGGGYASAGVPKGGTKTIGYGYDPNPGNVSLAYVMRNAPEQERRNALINKWNQENGRESVPYVPGTEIPAGSLNRSSSTYASSGIGNGGTYATGEGIKDANGNVLTNPGGDWEYQYALKNPQYGLGMMGKMSDAQRNYLQAVSDDMGYNYNFRGATRFV